MADKVDRDVVAKLCKQFGGLLHLDHTKDDSGNKLEGVSLLWAIAGCESSFGANCGPRVEPAYLNGKYSKQQNQAELNFLYGKDGASSLGPWQLMAIHGYTSGFTPKELRQDAEKACLATVGFLNRVILDGQHAQTLGQIGDAYNSGNFQDRIIPKDYMAKLRWNYYTEVLA